MSSGLYSGHRHLFSCTFVIFFLCYDFSVFILVMQALKIGRQILRVFPPMIWNSERNKGIICPFITL